MAKSIDSRITLSKLEDGEQVDSLVAQLTKSGLTDIAREEFTVTALLVEASYKPPAIGTINFLFITADNEVLVRTVAAGAQYSIPALGFLIFMNNTADLDDILIEGGAVDAKVVVWVGE